MMKNNYFITVFEITELILTNRHILVAVQFTIDQQNNTEVTGLPQQLIAKC
jgi:hypothetical protein